MAAKNAGNDGSGSKPEIMDLTPVNFRAMVREGLWTKPTAGCCPDFVQLNLVILPQFLAEDFKEFCERNPQPCPLLETIEAGRTEAIKLAPGSDIRTDLPAYRVYRGKTFTLADDITDIWREDFVSFLIGCSFTFEEALLARGVPVRHIEIGTNVPMYITDIPCQAAGPFHGNMVVSMRPIPLELVETAYSITGHYPAVHGAPVHHGDPGKIGIANLERPDYGDPVPVRAGEVPVFWACGVTPQAALINVAPDIAITHAPGYMFVSDRKNTEYYQPLSG